MAKKKENLTPEEAKKASLEEAKDKIIKQYGAGSIMKLGEKPKLNIDTISTGSILIDEALGVGGIAKGRITEIYGAESSGKTTLTLHIIAQAQKAGGVAAFIDAEHALDPIYAKTLGVNIDELLISQPDTGEQALSIVEQLVLSSAVDIIVVDSVAALTPLAELEGNMNDQQMGLQARMMAKGLRKITANISKSNCAVIFINQLREKIGGYGPVPQTTTPGGRSLKFYSTVRMEVKKGQFIKVSDEEIGTETIIKIQKNKLAPPFKIAKVSILYGQGIRREFEILEKAINYGICKKSGSWYSYGETRLGQGLMNVIKILQDDEKLTDEIYEKIKAKETEESSKQNKKIEKEDIPDNIKMESMDDTIDLSDIEENYDAD